MDFLFLEIVYNATTPYAQDKICELLEAYEIFDFELKEPMSRNPLDYYANNLEISPDYFAVKIYLEENNENKILCLKIAESMVKLESVLKLVNGRVEESEWKDKWKEYFKPIQIGCSLVVRPIWEEYTPKYGEKLIVIDPQMAFGTGTHATTAHCLRFVEKYVKVGDRVLDIGTGSSILLVASKLFGASKLIGVDIDEEALLSAEENLKLNGISDYELSTSFSDSRSYDVVIANIICEVLIDLFNSMVNKMQKNGLLFLSGILIEKTGKMEAIILHSKLEIVEKSIEDGWVGYVCKKSY